MTDAIPHADVLNQQAQGQLKAVIERVERVEADEAEQRSFKKDIYAEAKSAGFDVKAIKKVVRLRKIDRAKRQEDDAILDTYLVAVGEA